MAIGARRIGMGLRPLLAPAAHFHTFGRQAGGSRFGSFCSYSVWSYLPPSLTERAWKEGVHSGS